jgi:glycosyltransferase involved in cell wall biosynthesis
MGWASMNRCWHALDQQSRVHLADDLQFVCPLQLPPVEQAEAARWKQQLSRLIVYPAQVALLRGVDAVHILDHSFANLLRWVKPGVKKVVTVHDLIPLLDSTGLTRTQVQRFRERVGWLDQADLLLCVSEFTKVTVIEQLGIHESKIRVLPNGVELPDVASMGNRSRALDALQFPIEATSKLLVVGSNLERKNLRLIPEVLRHLKAKGLSPAIIRVGPAFRDDLRQAILSIIDADHLVELGLVSDETLSAAYRAADLLFFPSKLEGFGLPVLEAMAHGCPVVCSNSSSLSEVGGEAALYFDPSDAAAAAQQVSIVATERERLRSAGLDRAKQFTWAQHWAKLCDLYRSL